MWCELGDLKAASDETLRRWAVLSGAIHEDRSTSSFEIFFDSEFGQVALSILFAAFVLQFSPE